MINITKVIFDAILDKKMLYDFVIYYLFYICTKYFNCFYKKMCTVNIYCMKYCNVIIMSRIFSKNVCLAFHCSLTFLTLNKVEGTLCKKMCVKNSFMLIDTSSIKVLKHCAKTMFSKLF